MLRYFLLTTKAQVFASETKVVFRKFARKIQHALFMIVKLKVFGMLYIKGARSDLWQCFRTQNFISEIQLFIVQNWNVFVKRVSKLIIASMHRDADVNDSASMQ